MELHNTIECTHGAVLSLVAREDILYAGCQDGYVRVWDLQTNTFIRTIIVQEVNPLSHNLFSLCAHLRAQNVDILSLSLLGSDIYVCSANGQVKVIHPPAHRRLAF